MTRFFSYIHNLIKTARRKTTLPRMLTYIVSFRCNAKCIMCDSWKKDYADDELTLSQIEDLFDQMPQMDVVRLSGGEPFIRKDLPQIAEAVRTKLKPGLLHITSNGFLTDRIVEFCKTRDRSLPLFLLFSIDGMGEKHNKIRGTHIAWDKVTATMKALAPLRKELNMQIAVNQTIVDAEGVEHYEQLRRYLRHYGINNNVVMAYDASATYAAESDEKDIAPKEIGEFFTYGDFTDEDVRRLFDNAEKNLKSYPFFERISKRYYFKGIRNRLLGNKVEPNPFCIALNSHMRLFPDGRIPTCQFNSASIGNVKEGSFREIWFGEKAEALRKWVADCPGCWAECEILPNAFYTGDIFKHLL